MSFVDDKSIFSNRLRQERENLKLMQKEMAQKLNLPANTYNGYETGKRSPALDVAKHIADTLDISVDYLLGRTDQRNLNIEKEKTKLNKEITTISAHRIDGGCDNLPDEAIEKINDYIEMIKLKYNK